MPVRDFQLLGFEDAILLRSELLPEGTLPWLLREHAALLFPAWLFEGWKGAARTGRNAWAARTLMALLLLRHSEDGLTRVGAVRRAATDACWRAALRLPWRVDPPDEKTVREFEAFLRTEHPTMRLPRMLVAFEYWTRLALDEGLLGPRPTWVIDSTPMWCFGALLDTVNLLGEGVRSLARQWARARGTTVERVAGEWGTQLLTARSTKGHFGTVDWTDPDARSNALSELASTVTRVVELVQAGVEQIRQNKREPLLRRCRNLLRVVTEDLERDDRGRLVIARRRTSERLISLTDPEAQHFRKSESQVCSGYKLHVLGDAVSGLILALSVTPGGTHDGSQTHPLISRAKTLHAQITEVLGDSQYGRMPERQAAASLGVTMVAPPPKADRGEGLGKADFDIDFDTMTATCPGGVSTSTWKYTKQKDERVPTFCWPVGSEGACTCRQDCPAHRRTQTKTGRDLAPRRRLPLHPQEQDLRAIREQWKRPDLRQKYRLRSQGERLVREMTRRGARRAAAWGLAAAEFQARCIAAANNLRLLAARLAAQGRLAA